MAAIDLNADLGEGAATDAQLLEVITSASIACGGHAGDAVSMDRAVAQAVARGVAVGAHPSFPDRAGFGRRPMVLPPDELRSSLIDQIGALMAVARRHGIRLQHVKPHGALYNQAARDAVLATAVGEAVRAVDPALIVVALAGSPMVDLLERMGLAVAQEAFVDRGYAPDGTLLPRDRPGAIIAGEEQAAVRAVRLVRDRVIEAADGSRIAAAADTLCIHGDTPNAPALARAVRAALHAAGVRIVRMETLVCGTT